MREKRVTPPQTLIEETVWEQGNKSIESCVYYNFDCDEWVFQVADETRIIERSNHVYIDDARNASARWYKEKGRFLVEGYRIERQSICLFIPSDSPHARPQETGKV